MTARTALFAAALTAAALFSTHLTANDVYDESRIYGANTLRYSQYDASGDTASGPYPFTGDFYFDEFNVYLDRRASPYDRWRAEVSGVANISDRYRTNDNGFVPERLNLTRENGEGLPYRAEVGDFFGYYSYLTLQRSLKGAQLELQPFSGNASRQYSVIVTAGALESNWRDLTLQDNFTTGASFLIQDETFGTLNFNLAHNYRDNSNRLGTLDRSQIVFSVAGEKTFGWAGQQFLLESEIAHFDGDHDGRTGAASGQDRHDGGYFAQLSGRSNDLPLDYRFRFEYYGQDFRPTGAIVSFDRRSVEAHSGWRFDTGLRLRGRAQLFEDAFETTNKTRTRTFGANLSGPILQGLASGISTRADAFVQILNDELKTVSRHTKTFDWSISAPLPGEWTSRTALFIQNRDEQVIMASDLFTRQLSFDADHGFSFAGFSGTVTPGATLRTLRRGGNFSTDFFPTLAVNARRDKHSLRLNYGARLQNRKITVSGPDIETHQFNADYRFTNDDHVFGLEGNFFNRDPIPGQDTNAWRVSLYWTWSFDKPPAALAQAPQTPSTGLSTGAIDVLNLALGSGTQDLERALQRAGAGTGTLIAGYQVYEYPVLDEIFQRQRLATSVVNESLSRVVLIIDFDDIGNRDSIAQTFERVRQQLIRRFGSPTRTLEEGEFDDNFVNAVNSQRLIRIIEWKTPAGTVRFGIPRRLDGQVRMEVQHAPSFTQPRETLWSIEGLR
ncbi:MAG: hypothetical protein AAF384_14270 [Pseudomonadota bacterium]